jgi:DNA-binding PadR family transcriptional regulator
MSTDDQVSPRHMKALRECFEYTKAGRKYRWMQRSMEDLAKKGLAEEAGLEHGQTVYAVSEKGRLLLGEPKPPRITPDVLWRRTVDYVTSVLPGDVDMETLNATAVKVFESMKFVTEEM